MALPQLNTATKYELKMPSTGETIEYRPYLVKEEKILMIAMESQDQKQIIRATRDVIQSCTFDKINIMNYPMFDLEYVFLKLRTKSVGETSKLKFACEKCQTPNDYNINLDELEPIGKTVENTIALTDTIGVTMKYPTVKDMNDSTSEAEIDLIFDILVSSIDSIYDAENVYPASENTKAELNQFIENLNQKQFNKLQEWFEAMPKLKKTVEFTCTKSDCSHENSFYIESIQSFFG